MTSIVVLISGSGTNLQAIIDACERGDIRGQVSAVISNQEDAYGLTRAENANIPTHVISHKAFDSREAYDAELKGIIDHYHPQLVVLAGFMRILSDDFVQHYSGRMLNIHPSLLPKYKGLHTHKRAIEAGDKEHGATVHFVTPELDGGPTIIQSRVPVFEDDDEDTLSERVRHQELRLYPLVVKWFCDQRLALDNSVAVMDGQPIPVNGYASDD